MYTDLSQFCINQHRSIREAIVQMDKGRLGIVLVIDENRRLIGTVTDGDVRRAVLDRVDLDQIVRTLLTRKAKTKYAVPITAPIDADPNACLQLLKQHSIIHLPLLDPQQRVAGLVTLDEFLPDRALPVRAIVMAGGAGQRLRPLTEETPKPMLHIAGRPLLEIIIEQLRDVGVKQVTVTTHHKRQKIADHFGDGKNFGVELSYVEEDLPLGTVGGLGLLEPPTSTTLVINGDILTQVDFRAMLAYHREHQADLTIAVRHYELKVPYGVVECAGPAVQRLNEKPVVGFFVNAGIYLLEPVVHRFIAGGERLDMTELIHRLLAQDRAVASFPVREYWVDIGEQGDYQRAQEQASQVFGLKRAKRRRASVASKSAGSSAA